MCNSSHFDWLREFDLYSYCKFICNYFGTMYIHTRQWMALVSSSQGYWNEEPVLLTLFVSTHLAVIMQNVI